MKNIQIGQKFLEKKLIEANNKNDALANLKSNTTEEDALQTEFYDGIFYGYSNNQEKILSNENNDEENILKLIEVYQEKKYQKFIKKMKILKKKIIIKKQKMKLIG